MSNVEECENLTRKTAKRYGTLCVSSYRSPEQLDTNFNSHVVELSVEGRKVLCSFLIKIQQHEKVCHKTGRAFGGQHKDIVSTFKQKLQLLSPDTNIELQLH